jgi:formylglycine-generating enzyme required for sulfatase activity
MQIFISYSTKDRPLVADLAEDLKALDHDVWFDPELVRNGGQKWWDNILRNVRECDLFVFALTPQSLTSEACEREYGYAYSLGKNILPIMLADVDIPTLPPELQELQFVNYTERSKRQLAALAASLNKLPVPRPLPDPMPDQPKTPLSPMSRIGVALESPSLSGNEQITLIFELETLFNNPTTRRSAESLLRKLHDRDDATRAAADKIRTLIPDISEVLPIPAETKPEAKPGVSGSMRGLAVIAIVLIILIIGGLVLPRLIGGSATPTLETPTKVAQGLTATNTLVVSVVSSVASPSPVTATRTPTTTSSKTPIPPTVTPSLTVTRTPIPPTSTPTLTATYTPTTVPSGLTNVPTVTGNSQWKPQTQAFDGVEMVLVPPGCFMMGNDNGESDAKPQTRICFSKAFWIDKYEVTNQQFLQFNGKAASSSSWKQIKRPRERITWFESQDFCNSRGESIRLPTEAEWEYTARGPNALTYPWGNNFSDNIVYNGNSGGQTANVGSKPEGASWVGALDLSGNVWEWTSSLYKPYPYSTYDGRESRFDSRNSRVVRGASWAEGDNLSRLTSIHRDKNDPNGKYSSVGFRCARDF